MNSILIQNNTIAEPVGVDVWEKNKIVFIQFTDSRIIGFPASRFKLLKNVTDAELENVELRLNGYSLRWEDLDEDITVKGILLGNFQLKLE